MSNLCRLIIWIALSRITSSTNCTLPWLPLYKTSCYNIVMNFESWNEARLECLRQHANLINFNSPEEENAITTYLKKKYANHYYWTGGRDFGQEGHWVWDPMGKALTYTNWKKGEPNGGYYQNCLLYSYYKWQSDPCDILHYFICEN